MDNTIIIVFGDTGDLFKRKILPAIYKNFEKKLLPNNLSVIGISRSQFTEDRYRHEHLKGILNKALPDEFINKFSHLGFDISDKNLYTELIKRIIDIESNYQESQIIFYFALKQSLYPTVIKGLKIIEKKLKEDKNKEQIKILLEKPIGTDYESAVEIENLVSNIFIDDQIYRIDHYLHKKSLQNIYKYRRANKQVEATWNNQFIKNIEIKTLEDFGVEERGAFYDPLGALKDVGQNHLIEMLALSTMNIDGENIQRNRANAIKNIFKYSEEEIIYNTFRGQYKGYRDIDNVDIDSTTETYFKLRLKVDSPRWRNVPITIHAGKSLGEHTNQVIINYRDGSKLIFDSLSVNSIVNSFEFDDDDCDVVIQDQSTDDQYVAEYMHIFEDAIEGDRSWFVSKEEVLNAWEVIDPIVDAWSNRSDLIYYYDKKTNQAVDFSNYLNSQFSDVNKEILLVGLGKMGGNLAKNLKDDDYRVVVHNRSDESVDEFKNLGFEGIYDLEDIVNVKFAKEKAVWLMLPAGKPTNDTIETLSMILKSDDLVIDGGNSFYKDSIRNYQKLKQKGINFLDAGVSGGPSGARNGACIMIGGEKEVYKKHEHIFASLSLPGGYKYFGNAGSGHFVKMVHNGIEYGIMQAIAEGFNLMNESREFESLRLKDIAEVYSRGSVIESRLIEWLYNAFKKHTEELDSISGEVSHSGEGLWTVETAKEINTAVKIIEEALRFRIESKNNPSFTGKIVSALRGEFGGHDVGKA